MNASGAEVVFLFLPLGAMVFALAALWQILKGMGEVTAELARIRGSSSRTAPSSDRIPR